MSKHLFRRSLGLVLALMLVLSALPVTALAAEPENSEFTITELVATDVTLDETVFEYTGSEIRPNVTVRVQEHLLTLDQDYTLEYANNIEVGEGKVIVTGIATSGYSGTVELPFYINEKQPEFTLVTIKGTDVIINGTSFPYTGEPIEPAITVTIDGKTLTPGQDYAIEYVNNLVPGTGTVIVRGIATASETVGYTGEVRMDFTIEAIPEEAPDVTPDETPEETPGETPGETPEQKPEEYPLVELKHEHVTINGKEFVYTGKAIEPEITVTVDGKVLTAGKDYSLKYENNVEVGSGKAIISGIATATEEGGYTGTVEVRFTIRPMTSQEYPLVEIKGTDVTMEGTSFFYTGKAIEPKITVTIGGKVLVAGKDYNLTYENNVNVGTGKVTVSGIATATETGGYTGTVELNFTILPRYSVTKGDGAVWNQNSGKTLTFTADGPYDGFDYLTVDGKTVPAKYYTVKSEDGTTLTLKRSFLDLLGQGSHSIKLHFTDGAATATFRVAAEADDSNPKTEDSFPLHLLSAVMFVSLTGIIASGYVWFKKLRK